MWDPDKYLDYAEQRARPFHDLVAHIEARAPRRVVDLGCGPGNLTLSLRQRWPMAALEAMDLSPEMVNAAQSRGIDARRGDVRDWEPRPDTDVVVCNSVLHWVPNHRELLKDWVGQLYRGAYIAAQMPANFVAPSHVLIRELVALPKWARLLAGVQACEVGDVDDPLAYAQLLHGCGCGVDAWETTYLQRMIGKDPVLEWLRGTALRSIEQALEPEDWARFRLQLAALLSKAYPAQTDGVVWFPFRRIFFVARVR